MAHLCSILTAAAEELNLQKLDAPSAFTSADDQREIVPDREDRKVDELELPAPIASFSMSSPSGDRIPPLSHLLALQEGGGSHVYADLVFSAGYPVSHPVAHVDETEVRANGFLHEQAMLRLLQEDSRKLDEEHLSSDETRNLSPQRNAARHKLSPRCGSEEYEF